MYIAGLGLVTALLWLPSCARSDDATAVTPATEAKQSPVTVPPSPPPAAVEVAPPTKVATPAPPPKVRTYKIVEGDTLERIALRFGLKAESIANSNPEIIETVLQIGEDLQIPSVDGLLHMAAEGDTLWDIARDHGVEVDDVIRANPDVAPDALQPGATLLVPGGVPVRRSNQVASRAATPRGERPATPAPTPTPAPSSIALTWPLTGEISEYFGWRTHPVYGTRNYHEAIDIAVPEETPVVAITSGTVVLAEWYGGYGLTVKIDHGSGLISRYSHNGAILVEVGQQVARGEIIARSGNTGVSTGPHLDFGLYRGGKAVDPLALLP